MNQNRENMIAAMTEELEPVRGFSQRDGLLLFGAATLVTIVGVAAIEGLWSGIVAGQAGPFFWVTNGLLLLLGLASAAAVIAMASPGVGNRHDAPKWSSAMLGVVPLAAIAAIFSRGSDRAGLSDPYALHCVSASLIAALVIGGTLTLWLRRGAPVSLNLAGWFTGLAAGATGTMLYGLSCPIDTVAHLGIWHVVPVAAAAMVGRLVVPKLVNW